MDNPRHLFFSNSLTICDTQILSNQKRFGYALVCNPYRWGWSRMRRSPRTFPVGHMPSGMVRFSRILPKMVHALGRTSQKTSRRMRSSASGRSELAKSANALKWIHFFLPADSHPSFLWPKAVSQHPETWHRTVKEISAFCD